MFGSKTDTQLNVVENSQPVVPDQTFQSADFLNSQSSIIGSDLTISAQDLIVISQTSLQLDGKTMGEVRATEIIIGESAEITGTVIAETVVVHGEVLGTVRAPKVALAATARVEGEIHHNSIEIIEGAKFHGQSIYDSERANLKPKLDSA